MRAWLESRWRGRRARRDRGVTSLEMVGFVMPATIAVIVVIYSAFVIESSSIDVTAAAAAAARAASVQRTVPAARGAARQAAADDLAARSVTCARLDVELDISQWGRGGSVTVTVACTARLASLTNVDFAPGTLTTSARSTAPIETYRRVSPA